MRRARARFAMVAAIALIAGGCLLLRRESARIRPPAGVKPSEYVVVTTGYCPCGECCGWHRNWFGLPVFSSGPLKGKRKIVGQTASGTMARPGTIAADTAVFPFGTIIYVPGYGYGRVEDRGTDIRGYHLDLFYRTHSEARRHGRQRVKVKVWFPWGQEPASGSISGDRQSRRAPPPL